MATTMPSGDPSSEAVDAATESTTRECRAAKTEDTRVSSSADGHIEDEASLTGDWSVGRGAELLAIARAWFERGRDVTVDCSSLERLDVAAMQVLLAAKRKLATNGSAFRLAQVPAGVAETIRLTGLQELFS